jgi:hypothetical protein
MSDYIGRLRLSGQRCNSASYRYGEDRGAAWVRKRAEGDQLRRLEDAYFFHKPHWEELFDEQHYLRFIPDGGRNSSSR